MKIKTEKVINILNHNVKNKTSIEKIIAEIVKENQIANTKFIQIHFLILIPQRILLFLF